MPGARSAPGGALRRVRGSGAGEEVPRRGNRAEACGLAGAGGARVLPGRRGRPGGGERAGREPGPRGGVHQHRRERGDARRPRRRRTADAGDAAGDTPDRPRGRPGRGGVGGGLVIRFDCVTLFPETFAAVTASGVTSRALERGLWQLALWNPRDFTTDNYRTVDDRPYGGGPGM